jgi:hypothetical protein
MILNAVPLFMKMNSDAAKNASSTKLWQREMTAVGSNLLCGLVKRVSPTWGRPA